MGDIIRPDDLSTPRQRTWATRQTSIDKALVDVNKPVIEFLKVIVLLDVLASGATHLVPEIWVLNQVRQLGCQSSDISLWNQKA